MDDWKTLGEEGVFADVLRIARTCIRCGTEWRIDEAPAKLNGTDFGPVCRNRVNCDRRLQVRDSLARLRPIRSRA